MRTHGARPQRRDRVGVRAQPKGVHDRGEAGRREGAQARRERALRRLAFARRRRDLRRCRSTGAGVMRPFAGRRCQCARNPAPCTCAAPGLAQPPTISFSGGALAVLRTACGRRRQRCATCKSRGACSLLGKRFPAAMRHSGSIRICHASWCGAQVLMHATSPECVVHPGALVRQAAPEVRPARRPRARLHQGSSSAAVKQCRGSSPAAPLCAAASPAAPRPAPPSRAASRAASLRCTAVGTPGGAAAAFARAWNSKPCCYRSA